MADREGQGRGRPGEMEPGGIGPVIGDVERKTTPYRAPGREADRIGGDDSMALEGTAVQVLRDLRYPLARDDLVREAAGLRAPGKFLDLLTRLPNRVYMSAEDVAGEMLRIPAGDPGILR